MYIHVHILSISSISMSRTLQDQLRTLQQRQIPVSCCGAATGATLEEAVEAARGGAVCRTGGSRGMGMLI